jgi:hypothetical protein
LRLKLSDKVSEILIASHSFITSVYLHENRRFPVLFTPAPMVNAVHKHVLYFCIKFSYNYVWKLPRVPFPSDSSFTYLYMQFSYLLCMLHARNFILLGLISQSSDKINFPQATSSLQPHYYPFKLLLEVLYIVLILLMGWQWNLKLLKLGNLSSFSCLTTWKLKLPLNPLKAELNPICYLLILLGDLTFMGTYFVIISNKTQRYTVYLYLEIALHISGVTSTHHQERIQLYLQHLVFVTPLLLSAASNSSTIAADSVRQPQHTQTGSNSSTIASDSSNGVTNTRCCRYSCMRSWW